MVFDTINYLDLVNENVWEDSALYQTLTRKFLFVIFSKADSGEEGDAVSDRVFFWTMPNKDLETARKV